MQKRKNNLKKSFMGVKATEQEEKLLRGQLPLLERS